MARLSLTPTVLPGTGSAAPLDNSALITAGGLGSSTGVSFSNTGQQWLEFLTVTGSTTVITNIGTTIEGEPVTSITGTAATTGHVYKIGPFNLDEDEPGGYVWVDFGTPANVVGVALFTF